MATNIEIKGLVSYLTKLSHIVDSFKFKFVNVEVDKVIKNGEYYPEIRFDLDITPKQEDIPYLWDFFHCKSNHIMQDGCEMVGIDWSKVFSKLNYVYYNGEKIRKLGGYIPDSFVEKISDEIKQTGPKQIKTHFFCGGKKKDLVLDITYELSDIYVEDGITTDISVYCSQVSVDGEPLENIPQDLAETIVGYVSEDDNIRMPLDDKVWSQINKYMNLESCEIWTYTYVYIRNIGDTRIESYYYIGHSTFSSKLCDFISGDY
jgi:hypothetical protein